MSQTLKFVGLFFVFMFSGALITGLIMGSLHTTKTFEVKSGTDICWNYMADTAHISLWMVNLESLTATTTKNNYKVKLSNGEGKRGNFDLEIHMDSTQHNLVYELNNRGSNLEIHFSFEPANNGTKVRIEHRVKGKGIANKLVLAMLNKSLKKQYELETNRIKQLLHSN